MTEAELYRFADWVASEVCREDFEDNSGAFAEIACRKLYSLGLLEKDEDLWIYNDKEMEMNEPDVVYICKGTGMRCYLCPGCVYREDSVAETGYICSHTLNQECAKYGKCEDPENHPERFIFQERSESCSPSYYWEVEPNEHNDLYTDSN